MKSNPKLAILTVRQAAQAYLAGQYGYLPALASVDYWLNELPKEVESFRTALSRLKDRIDYNYGTASVEREIVSGDPSLANNTSVEITEIAPFEVVRTYSAEGGWSGDPHHEVVYRTINSQAKTYFRPYIETDKFYATFDIHDVINKLGILEWLGSMVFEIGRLTSSSWQVLPLSFVADWFVDVTSVLQRFDAMVSATLKGLAPIDGVWRCTRVLPGITHNIPDALDVHRDVIPSKFVTKPDGALVPTELILRNKYRPIYYFRERTLSRGVGKYFIRESYPMGLGQILLPEISLNLNLSKIASIIALSLGLNKS